MSTEKIRSSRPLTKASMGIQPGLPLEAGGGGLDDLRRAVQMLLDIEAIKQVKHAYFRCIDTHNMAELAELMHDDVDVLLIGGTYEWKLKGRKEYLAAIDKSFHKRAIGHHNGHQPEIQIHSATEATGIWYLADHMWILDIESYTTGTALYWDRYVKVDGHWKIRETRYERLYEINQKLAAPPPLAAHYLGFHGS
ncbi:MAG: nuclear transport factor 2 family protein [Deltaproteobacteria bacterium]|nr:nuclear transport factor 2 family protein [Deltaproteobacteria bacterium]